MKLPLPIIQEPEATPSSQQSKTDGPKPSSRLIASKSVKIVDKFSKMNSFFENEEDKSKNMSKKIIEMKQRKTVLKIPTRRLEGQKTLLNIDGQEKQIKGLIKESLEPFQRQMLREMSEIKQAICELKA